jgi:hypothetical protein
VGGNFCVPEHPTWRFVVKEGGPKEKPLAMPEDKEIFPILESCWRELQRLQQSAAQLKSACATNERVLTGVKKERGSYGCHRRFVPSQTPL